jgi:hypothetical protein
MKDEIVDSSKKIYRFKTFFRKKALQNQVILNKNFLVLYDSINNQTDSYANIMDSASKIANAVNYITSYIWKKQIRSNYYS